MSTPQQIEEDIAACKIVNFMVRWYAFQRDRCAYLEIIEAVKTIQRFYRKKLRFDDKRLLSLAAILLQSAWRMCIARKIFLVKKYSARLLQSHIKRWLLKRRELRCMLFELGYRAASSIQAIVRGFLLRRNMHRLRKAVIALQSRCRGIAVRSLLRIQIALIIGEASQPLYVPCHENLFPFQRSKAS